LYGRLTLGQVWDLGTSSELENSPNESLERTMVLRCKDGTYFLFLS